MAAHMGTQGAGHTGYAYIRLTQGIPHTHTARKRFGQYHLTYTHYIRGIVFIQLSIVQEYAGVPALATCGWWL